MSDIRNLDYLREKDPRLFEALSDIITHHKNLAEQVNGNSTGDPIPPAAPQGLTVTGKDGHFQVAIKDENPVYRGVHYYAEHADNPNFHNSQIVHMGTSRNHSLFLGNATRYWRAYAAYGTSKASAPVFHGSAAEPLAVAGGGTVPPPEFLKGEGSGSGAPGQGLSGPGPVPFRPVQGKPPLRGESNPNAGGGGGLTSASKGLPPGAIVGSTLMGAGGGGWGIGGGTGTPLVRAGRAINAAPEENAFGTVGIYTALGLGDCTGLYYGDGSNAGLIVGIRGDITKAPFTAIGVNDLTLERQIYYGGGLWGTPDANSHYFYTANDYDETPDAGILRFAMWNGIVAIGGTIDYGDLSGSALYIDADKTVTIADLAGTGTRTVCADENGKLVAGGSAEGQHGFCLPGALTVNGITYTTIPADFTLTSVKLICKGGTCTVKILRTADGAGLPDSGDSLSTSGWSVSSGEEYTPADMSDLSSVVFTAKDNVGLLVTAVSGATMIQLMGVGV